MTDNKQTNKELTKKIKDFILKEYPDWENAEQIDENLAISGITIDLENKGLIEFCFSFRENESETWLQVEYWSDKIRKTIIMDYDAPSYFDTYDGKTAIDTFVEILIDYQNQVKELENKLFISL